MSARRFICFLFVVLPIIQVVNGQVDGIKSLKAHYQSQLDGECLMLWTEPSAYIRQIILIRHGEPDLNKRGWRNRKEAIQYMHDYDSVGVVAFTNAPICTEHLHVKTIYHSSIPRATNTAQLAFEQYDLTPSPDFREFERKTMKFFNIKLPLKFWTIGSRLLWFMGVNKKSIESFIAAKHRAESNAVFLANKSNNQGFVILVAHGLHNKYVKKYLRKMGWKKVYDSGNGYLSVKVLVKQK